MAPKPFPFPLGVGLDICRVQRIAAILQEENVCNRWVRKTFTRLEWPTLCRRFKSANRVEGESSRKAMRDTTALDGNPADHVWKLPKLSRHVEALDDPSLYWSTIADDRSQLAILAHFLAGRWAAKEAVIKAHRHRRLYMHEISIVQYLQQGNTIALVDPICNTVEMNDRIAKLRGLRGFSPQSQSLPKETFSIQDGDGDTTQPHKERSRHFNRRRKIKESDRQIAKVSISHDGEYASAVCMAFDSPELHAEGRQTIDDGSGPPVHEPQWGDEGWFETDVVKDDDWKNKTLRDFLVDPEPVINTETYGKAFKETLEDTDRLEHWKIPPLP